MADKKRDFKAEFDDWFEECSLEDVHYAITEFEHYGWLVETQNKARQQGVEDGEEET